MARPRNPLLSRERIVAAALAVVDAEGLPALSTRRLAVELGVSGPSLYNHFGSMDELVDALVDEVIGQVDLSMFAADRRVPWPEALRAWARSYRAALVGHPRLVPALAQGPKRRPHWLHQADVMFGALVAEGWPRGQATRIGALMRYYITGSALGSFALSFTEDGEPIESADYPHLGEAHLLTDRQREIDESAFELGLDSLIAGLTARYREIAARPRQRLAD
ncbi:TetR/AcrR family transcriptional regulator [Phaeacidiphilus oryzae]|uniref:TetR/AcrR family transcriptional regulator n=1 Tax=Phaeacidiphilus oryzae TaxID=348818 RepID=UPI0005611FF3|nr:TetR/AcrR family transcriptional regulator [Phaeacidiphilus oryzae]